MIFERLWKVGQEDFPVEKVALEETRTPYWPSLKEHQSGGRHPPWRIHQCWRICSES